ncbi:MAG TPA: response regulator [Thermoanaerobaculia bacterium]|nr:response regulator [Thermoanaerobaculia bacterium]
MSDALSNRFTIRVLGGFHLVSAEGTEIPLASRKAQVLLGYLGQRPGQTVSRGKIASMLWRTSSEHEARHSLRQCLLVLRKSMGDPEALLHIEQEAIALRTGVAEIDAARFERLVAEGTEQTLREAIALYRGEFLEGISLAGEPVEEWIVFERRRLAHLMKKALGALLASSHSEGRIDEAIQIATRLLAIDPLQGDVQKTLSRLYGGTPPATAFASGRSVLVADADPSSRQAISDALRAGGYDVRTCTDGADLLLEIGALEPDLLVVDLHLPMFGGIELIHLLASRRPHLPVIGIRESAEEELEAEALLAGAADFLRRPLTREVLMLRIENVLRYQSQKRNGAVS